MKKIIFIALSLMAFNSFSYEKAEITSNEAFYQAAKAGDVKALKNFIKEDKELINIQNDQGYTALIYAAYYGQEAAVNFLLKSGADSCMKDKRGNTASMGAIFKGNFKIAKTLLSAKCGVNEVNIQGQTGLMYAALFGRADIAKKLLVAGENPDQEDYAGFSARTLASNQGNLEILEIFDKDLKATSRPKDHHDEMKRRVFSKELKHRP